MPDFEVKITTPMQLQGAPQLAGQPGKDIGKTNAPGDATTASAREEAKQGGEGAHEAHAAVQARGGASPGVGQMARFFADGVTATLGGVILVLSKFQEAMRETMESLKAAAHAPEAELKKLPGNINVEREKSAALENVRRQKFRRTSETGTAAPQQREQVRDTDAQPAWANAPGTEMGIDIDSARAALDAGRRHFQGGQDNAQELRDLMNEFIGLAADIHASAAQKRDVSDLERQVEELRRSERR